MKKFSLRLFTLALVTTAGAAIAGVGDNEALKQITGYREWTRVKKSVPTENISIGG